MNRPSSALACATLLAIALATLTPRRAFAGDTIADLEKSLSEEHAALSTSDCSAACRALASIRRAADRICALEPGPRCSAAQVKSEEATRRVREACPDCALASSAPAPERAPATKPAMPADAPRESVTTAGANGPRSESSRGGCASCDAGGASPGDASAGVLAILALARVLRRRKSR